MRLTQLLTEITRPPHEEAFSMLFKAGYHQLGVGKYGMAFAKPNDPFVLKLFEPTDIAYIKFIELTKKYPSKHWPKFRSNPFEIKGAGYMAIRIEKLQPIESFRLLDRIENYAESLVNNEQGELLGPDATSIKKCLNVLYTNIVLPGIGRFDIHGENIMMRGDTVVFIDPVYARVKNLNINWMRRQFS